MMPSAKIVKRRSCPPLNRSTKPRKVPRFCSKNCCSRSALIPGVGMCPPRRYTASSPRVNRMRLRRSGTRNTLASFSSMREFTSLGLRLLISALLSPGRFPLVRNRRDRDLDNLGLAAGIRDLLLRRLGELVGLHGDGGLKLAVTQDLDARVAPIHDACLAQHI